ncbi:hypothetical protein L2E82_46481 [Cichorium intybus]|uniref:Uncharacterized protein n=1 Tax=Cichorium intybus TaxID=13427 RepID=A0ACB8YTS9_CICIN|nr:hypothetical protein L2E82_46481 [Cichorium intybus]
MLYPYVLARGNGCPITGDQQSRPTTGAVSITGKHSLRLQSSSKSGKGSISSKYGRGPSYSGYGMGSSSSRYESVERSEEDLSRGDAEVPKSNWTNEDRALKERLLRKYSKYISSLKHEFSNKKKKGKLPKEARQVLLDWWSIHYRWPYPTEADKIALAESTGLDQKQINNWFINQRKRHWKPSENMQFAVMDSLCGSFLVNN